MQIEKCKLKYKKKIISQVVHGWTYVLHETFYLYNYHGFPCISIYIDMFFLYRNNVNLYIIYFVILNISFNRLLYHVY